LSILDKTPHTTDNNGGHYVSAPLILFQDTVLSVLASLLSILLVRWLGQPIMGFTHIVMRWLLCALAATVLGILLTGSHKAVRRWSTLKSVTRTGYAILIKEVIMIIAVILGIGGELFSSVSVKVLVLLADVLLTGLLLMYMRVAARMMSKSEVSKIREEASRKNALIVGTGEKSVEMAHEMALEGNYNIIGYLTTDREMAGRVIADKIVYYCSDPSELRSLEWRLGGVDCLFIPKGEMDLQAKKDAESGESSKAGKESETSSPVSDGMSLFGKVIKRSFDIIVSGVLLIVFSPLALISAIAVKLDDGGPVLYKQERVGLGGKTFNILKFRSMKVDAEANGAQLYSGDEDPRLTKAGAFLRKHHLDELPQLWNVFRGDMSFIGYRPERQYYIDQIEERNPRYRYLYQIRPGVTSYATLYNGYTDTIEKMLTRLDLDLYYLRNHSIWFDCRILWNTFLSIVSGKKF